jgi:long-chain acyl-CoA synthetase
MAGMGGPSDWLREEAGRHPRREALSDGETVLSFELLFGETLKAARWIGRRGHPGDRVAIALPFGAAAAVLYFGTLLAGRVAVPLDPRLHPERLGFILGELDPVLIIGPPDLVSAGVATGAQGVGGFQDLQRLLCEEPGGGNPPAVERGPSRLLNIVYTSGSTGQPKGVMLTEGNLLSVTGAIRKALAFDESHRVFTPLPFAHTYGLSQLWLMARTGAGLSILPDITRVAEIRKRIEEDGIDVVAGVPYHFALLARRGGKERFDGVRKVTLAGESPSRGLLERVKAAFPRAGIYVLYGLTEASTRLTTLGPGDLDRGEGCIGRPIEGVELRIVDDGGKDAAEEGELWARGANVSPGYWNRDDLTAETFRDGWLRTGDLVRRDDEGFLYHEGRKDLVFKSGGEKIVPSVIERVLREMEGVADAAVAGLEDPYSGRSVCALVVPEEGSGITAEAVLAWCRPKLGRLWVPREVHLTREPLRGPGGKIDYEEITRQLHARVRLNRSSRLQKAGLS